MATIDDNNYVQRTNGRLGVGSRYRSWWLVKWLSQRKGGFSVGTIYLPPEFIGRRVKLKIEVLED